jgi:serine protease DegQ
MNEHATQVSDALAAAVERAGASLVRVEGGRRFPATGIAWSADGLIVTVHHALEDESELTIGLPDGSEARAELVGRDPATDVALLRTDAQGLAPPAWAPEQAPPRVGSLVLAVARPGAGVRASLGVVSGLFSPRGHGRGQPLLLTDLRPGPGYSGGLLVDAGGRALGMHTAGWGRRQPLGLPVAVLRGVAEALQRHGRVPRGYLGVSVYPAQLPQAVAHEAGQDAALVVIGVEPDGPAARSGLLLGDVLLSLDGQPVGHVGALQAFLGEERAQAEALARIVRAGAAQELRLAIGTRP